MKVAIIHDWLTEYAGSERVLEQMLALFPQADLFSLIDFFPEEKRHLLQGKRASTSFLQKWPGIKKYYRQMIPLMPFAIEQLDLGKYDLLISSSHAVAKGILVAPHQLHICMCYSPIRYAWDMSQEYLRDAGLHRGIKSFLARAILHYVRMWDQRTANGVDHFIAISGFIAQRIQKVYRRESTVIYPPVEVDHFSCQEKKEAFYLAASRFVPYKRMDLIVEAFIGKPFRQLVVIGDGPQFAAVKKRAAPYPNIKLLGFQPFEVLKSYMERAQAFLFAAREDFGIAPLEAQACGTPVIAFGRGGAKETIQGEDSASPTGVFFYEQTVKAIHEAIDRFESKKPRFSPFACRENAERFSTAAFQRTFSQFMEEKLQEAPWNR